MHDFSNRRKKKIKNIWIKIEVEKEIERRGDNRGLFELLETKQKNFVFGITFLTFFKNNNLIK